MPAPSPSQPRRNARKLASAETVREIKIADREESPQVDALSTFSVDVSAGNSPQDNQSLSGSLLRDSLLGRLSRSANRLFVHDGKQPSHDAESLPKRKAEEPSVARLTARNGEAPVTIDLMASSPRWKRSRNRLQRRRLPYVITSVTIHGAILFVLSFYTFKQLRPADPPLLSALEPIDEIDLDADFELDADLLEDDLVNADSLEGVAAEPLLDLTESSLIPEWNADLELPGPRAVAGESPISGNLAGSLFEGEGQAPLQLDEPPDKPELATFFGTKIRGKRIVFFVDNSGGMQYGGFETLVDELLKTVEKLTEQQRFYVILYSDVAYPLFHPRPANQFIRPTPQNKQRLAEWLESVELCVGNAIDEGLAAATAIKPDTMFLLTDGRVKTTRDSRKLEMLLDSSRRGFVIHTFGMGTGAATQGAQQLKAIAAANDGEFRLVEISDEMKALARMKGRPYHSKQPGAVWGRKVGSW